MKIINSPESYNASVTNINREKFIEIVIEEYTIGNYKRCIQMISEKSEQTSISFELIEILIKSSLYIDYDINKFVCKSEFMKNKILIPMYKIYACDQKEENLSILLNSAKILGNVGYKYKILNFYLIHISDGSKKHFIYYNTMAEINSKTLTPRFAFVYTEKEKKLEYLNLIYKCNKYRETVSLINAYVTCDLKSEIMVNIPKYRLDFYKVRANKKDGLMDSIRGLEFMLVRISKIHNNGNNYKTFLYERIATELYKMYIEATNINEALTLVVDSYMLNKSSVLRMDKNKLCGLIEKQDIYLVNIKKIIFDYIVDEKDYFKIYTTLANFIENNGMKLPSDLISWNKKDPKLFKEISFILSKIYTKEIMKYFVRINPKKRNEERILVLNYLIEVDEKNSIKYSEEINNIMKAQSIQKRIKSVDEKKIFVDTEAILTEFGNVFKEKYRRYVALKELDQDLSFYDLTEAGGWEKFSQAVSEELSESQEKRQRYLMFKELINEFKGELLFNQNYGLAKFLSSRIRHGLLENNLSKTFKNYNLLSLKTNSEDTDFIVNKYWDDESAKYINELSEIFVSSIKNTLAKFSKNIIEKIDEVKEWIRITDKDHPDGMFDFSILSLESSVLVLYGAEHRNIEYRTFYDEIINYFWSTTEKILEVIRYRINNNLYEYFVNCLDDLQHEVEELKMKYISNESNELISNLLSKINLCRAVLKSDLKQISNWFIVRKSGEYYDYNLSELVSTCLEINNKTNKKYSLIKKSEKIETNIYLKGITFNYLIDVINILYSNAIQHSGFDKFEDMNIHIKIIEDNSSEIADFLENSDNYNEYRELIKVFRDSKYSTLKITIKNKLEDNKKSEDITNNINEIFKKIRNPDKYKNMVSEEGGTGLTKINNILTYNIGSLFFHQYFVDENNWFNAEIYINLQDILAVKEGD